MEIPSKIKVGDYWYKIIQHKKRFKYSDSEEVGIGEIRYTNKTIHLMVGDKRKKAILLHEILHSIFYFLGYDRIVKEKVIDGLVSGLRMVMIDNPSLIKLLKK